MFVITGATGNTGSAAAEALLAAGQQVRVVVRDPAKAKAKELAERGAQVVTADLNDEVALRRAFEGADGVYLMSPPDLTLSDFLGERKKLTDSLARVAQTAAVKHVVFLSSIGAHHPDGTGIIRSVYAGEHALRATLLPLTLVRAGSFMENWAGALQPAQQDGVLPSFVAADRAMPTVASRDVGKAVARALMDGPHGTRIIELAGPVDVTPNDVAAVLTRIFGRPVHVVEPPLSSVVPTMTSFGMSQNVAELMQEMYEGIANGKVAFAESGTEAQRGDTTVEEVLRVLTGKQ